MKKIITPLIVGIVIGIVGLYIGQKIGYENGKNYAEFANKLRDIEEIKTELRERESERIGEYLNGKAGIETNDEGSLFKVKYVQYFSGNLTNSAVLAIAKDVKLNVDYYSKTNTKIGSQEITIYEYIKPGQTVKFKEKINVPENVSDFKFQITDAKAE